MNKTYKVRSIGGALVVTLPRDVLRVVTLKAGDKVSITIGGVGRQAVVIIEPHRKLKVK